MKCNGEVTQDNYTLGCTTELKTICKEMPLKNISAVGHVIVVIGYLLSVLFVQYHLPITFLNGSVCQHAQFRVVCWSKIVTILSHRVTRQVADVARLL